MRLAVLALVLVGCGSSVETTPGGGAPPVETSPPGHEAGKRPSADVACSGPAAEACGYVRDIAAAAKRHYDETGVVCGEAAYDSPAWFPAPEAKTPSPADGADFHTGDATQGWKCLGYSVEHPMRYQIGFHRPDGGAVGCVGGTVVGKPCGRDVVLEATAKGDINNNAICSWFVIHGHLNHGVITLSEIETYLPGE